MDKKITIKNNYHKRLSCEAILGVSFAMERHEVKTVDYDIGIKLLQNVWITEVGKSINPECVPYVESTKVPIVKKIPKILKSESVDYQEIPKELITKESKEIIGYSRSKKIVNK